MNSSISFLVRSVLLGLIVAVVLLLAIPDLRHGNVLTNGWFDSKAEKQPKVSFSEAIAKAAPAVVNIYTQTVDTRPLRFRRAPIQRTSLGSGVIMSTEGFLLTCYHVIQNAERILVALQDGRLIQAQLVGSDRYTDLAVLKIEADNLPVIPQMRDYHIEVGDQVFSIGNPYNLGQTTTSGIISGTGRNRLFNTGYANFIQTNAVMNDGASGGALVDSNGNLVGINNSKFKVQTQNRVKDVEGMFFAMPFDIAKKVMLSIIESGRVIRGYLGITPQPRFRQVSETVIATEPGIAIVGIEPNSPADKAGLRVNDIIFSMGDVEIQQSEQALTIIENTAPGTVLDFVIIRDEQLVDIQVEIEALKN